MTGTYAFRADGTATFDGTFSGTVNDVLPAVCLVDPLTTCTALDADVKQRVAEPGSTYKSAACTAASSGGCACVWSFETTVTNSATYTTMGSTLTVTNTSSGATGTSSYCVQGSSLVISYPPSTPGGPPIIYVLTKRSGGDTASAFVEPRIPSSVNPEPVSGLSASRNSVASSSSVGNVAIFTASLT